MDEKGRWEPGESGNPNGRPPKEISLTELAKQYLRKELTNEKDEKKLLKEIFIEKVFNMAIAGDISAIKLLFNYVEGMPSQSIKYQDLSIKNPIAEEIRKLREGINKEEDVKENDITDISGG